MNNLRDSSFEALSCTPFTALSEAQCPYTSPDTPDLDTWLRNTRDTWHAQLSPRRHGEGGVDPAEEVHCSPRHSVRHAVDRVAEHAGSNLVIINIIIIIIIIIEQQLTRAMQASMSANVTRTCSLKVAFSMVEGSRLAKYVLMGPMISSMALLQSPPRSSSQKPSQSPVVMFTTAPVQSCLCWCMYRGWISLTSSAAPSRHHAMCGLWLRSTRRGVCRLHSRSLLC